LTGAGSSLPLQSSSGKRVAVTPALVPQERVVAGELELEPSWDRRPHRTGAPSDPFGAMPTWVRRPSRHGRALKLSSWPFATRGLKLRRDAFSFCSDAGHPRARNSGGDLAGVRGLYLHCITNAREDTFASKGRSCTRVVVAEEFVCRSFGLA
jgi:hypothetical protein